jgi:hypothetical protein
MMEEACSWGGVVLDDNRGGIDFGWFREQLLEEEEEAVVEEEGGTGGASGGGE